MVFMNPAFKQLITDLGLLTVPSPEAQGTLYEFVCGCYDLMVKGSEEGLIVVSPISGSDVLVSKWKIGAERNTENQGILDEFKESWGEDIFGENTDKAKHLIEMLQDIHNSK